MLKQNFPSQTCRERFIKLCACGPDFAARNECLAIVSNVYGTLYPLLCRTDLIFGNLEEIWEFHADTLLPQLESCHLNPTLIAKTFLEYCQHLTRMYCRSVVNQEYLTVGLLSAVCYRLFTTTIA